MIKRKKIILTGRVQGIGFRPAIYRLATSLNLVGFVYNDTRGVTIEIQGPAQVIPEFIERLKSGRDLPPLADIKTLDELDIDSARTETSFCIRQSESSGTALTQVTADIATCPDCLGEMADPNDFRYRYPFINCTNCGPRYSIIKTIPYDRPNTTMWVFDMCDKCARQYGDVTDRRFHAQPVACPNCGPKIWLTDSSGNIIEQKSDEVVRRTSQMLRDGKIVAVKGIGGFHLAVNAVDNDAVLRLRKKKRRDHKPFAMMADSVERIKKHAVVNELAERILRSPESPIVLMPKKKGNGIALSVAEGVNTFGFMLCYAPLHYLLFAEGLEVLVMTSGNISDEPLICKNDQALARLSGVADSFLMHNREIYRQVDDSIIHFIDGQAVLLRRARGYVPTPIISKNASDADIFAAGSEMKNTFSFAKQNQLICSEHIGDMEDAEVYHHYDKSVGHLAGLFEVQPKVVVCDLHPGYMSSQYARSIKGVKLIKVQHHWAHIASVLAEYGLDERVIGLECDGTGYGTDGAIWGCECLIASLTDFERFGHLAYYPLAGADSAAKEAIRPTLGLLLHAFGDEFALEGFDWLLDKIEPSVERQKLILEQIRKQVNTVDTSSLGRVFDAVATMTGLGNYNHFDAQLPMALEAAVSEGTEQHYDFEITAQPGEPHLLDLRKMIRQLLADLQQGISTAIISAKFHNCLAASLLELAERARENSGLNKVALSGGVFCNRYLTNRLIKLLKQSDFDVLFNHIVPSNDGGISLGQAAIAAKLLS